MNVVQFVVRKNRYFSTRTNGRFKWESGGRRATKSVVNLDCAVAVPHGIKVPEAEERGPTWLECTTRLANQGGSGVPMA